MTRQGTANPIGGLGSGPSGAAPATAPVGGPSSATTGSLVASSATVDGESARPAVLGRGSQFRRPHAPQGTLHIPHSTLHSLARVLSAPPAWSSLPLSVIIGDVAAPSALTTAAASTTSGGARMGGGGGGATGGEDGPMAVHTGLVVPDTAAASVLAEALFGSQAAAGLKASSSKALAAAAASGQQGRRKATGKAGTARSRATASSFSASSASASSSSQGDGDASGCGCDASAYAALSFEAFIEALARLADIKFAPSSALLTNLYALAAALEEDRVAGTPASVADAGGANCAGGGDGDLNLKGYPRSTLVENDPVLLLASPLPGPFVALSSPETGSPLATALKGVVLASKLQRLMCLLFPHIPVPVMLTPLTQ